MRTRIDFNGWNGKRKKVKWPAYAVQTEGWQTPSGVVAKAVARKNGLQVITLRADGYTDGKPQYQATLGTPISSGGYIPESEIWFSI